MRIQFYPLAGVIALSSLERKVGGVRKTTRYNHLLLMVKHPRLGRIATATPIGIYFAISAASCISKYEYKENFDEVFLFFRQYNFTVEAMASHPRYTGSRSHEFDIGFIQVSTLEIIAHTAIKHSGGDTVRVALVCER